MQYRVFGSPTCCYVSAIRVRGRTFELDVIHESGILHWKPWPIGNISFVKSERYSSMARHE